MELDWEQLLIAWLHDPPDKALDIRTHVARGARYLSAALDRTVESTELKLLEDSLAAVVERLPMPTAGSDGERAVGPERGALHVIHPLSGVGRDVAVPGVDADTIIGIVEGIVADLGSARARYLALWRLLPERLAQHHDAFAVMPADTRVPDHSIWNHMDITAAFHAARQASPQPGAPVGLLSFSLGPVQTFIEAARSVRDLWSGSMILSRLAFDAMVPVLEQLGPSSLIFPSLRGVPFVDRWLRAQLGARVPAPDGVASRSPCLPNRFLALVPWTDDGRAAGLADEVERCGRASWSALADAVRAELRSRHALDGAFPGWDQLWDNQVDEWFDFRTAVTPISPSALSDATLAWLSTGRSDITFERAFAGAGRVRSLADAIPAADRPGYRQDQAGRWQALVGTAAQVLEAARTVRHVPRAAAVDPREVPAKCTLLGSFEQMGPGRREDSAQFWGAVREGLQGTRLRDGERLCAVSLVKRFAVAAALADELGVSARELRFADTATIAAAEWLDQVQLDPDQVRREHDRWSGQWLHWTRPDQDRDDRAPDDVWGRIRRARQDSRPPTYFAVLLMDGDRMGDWLRGNLAPSVQDVLHPRLRDYFGRLPATAAALAQQRPLGPALHAAISTALATFATQLAPPIVARHRGQLIYAGGDDLLALLPVRTALACAHALRHAFSGDPDHNGGAASGFYRPQEPDARELPTMGERATLSAGLAVVHYKEDLRAALDVARRAEKAAKNAGRDRLGLAVCRRSGEHVTTVAPWSFVPAVERLVDAFVAGASDRWAYHLRAELPTLVGLPAEAMAAEIRRQVDRSEPDTRRLLAAGPAAAVDDAGAALAGSFDQLRACSASSSDATSLEDFVNLCQSASFLARGRDA